MLLIFFVLVPLLDRVQIIVVCVDSAQVRRLNFCCRRRQVTFKVITLSISGDTVLLALSLFSNFHVGQGLVDWAPVVQVVHHDVVVIDRNRCVRSIRRGLVRNSLSLFAAEAL